MSLIYGWLPITLQFLATVVLVVAIGWRTPRWRTVLVPIALLVGAAVGVGVRLFVKYQGWAEKPISLVPPLWAAVTGFAVAILVLGWRTARWWRRVVSVIAVPLCALSAASALNTATGYFPTVQSLTNRASGFQPTEWIDRPTLDAMVRDGARPTQGTVVSVDIPDGGSGFAHRTELVYLPPVWFSSNPPPRLPAVMAIGAEFSHPSDWLESGGAQKTLDEFAAQHDGNVPVVVFPDSTGSFDNDTECVNGPRGNAADHLTREVVPYVVSNLGVSAEPANWGLLGWSSGGTCALMLAVRHPELFSAFVDLDGQLGPNTGTKRQTIARLFDGDAEAWASFDPRTIVEKRGHYTDMSAWLGVSGETTAVYRPAAATPPAPEGIADWDAYSEDHVADAEKLCLLLSGHGAECAVVGYSGSHDFQSAAAGLAAALPWLASEIGTPDVPRRSLPGAP